MYLFLEHVKYTMYNNYIYIYCTHRCISQNGSNLKLLQSICRCMYIYVIMPYTLLWVWCFLKCKHLLFTCTVHIRCLDYKPNERNQFLCNNNFCIMNSLSIYLLRGWFGDINDKDNLYHIEPLEETSAVSLLFK